MQMSTRALAEGIEAAGGVAVVRIDDEVSRVFAEHRQQEIQVQQRDVGDRHEQGGAGPICIPLIERQHERGFARDLQPGRLELHHLQIPGMVGTGRVGDKKHTVIVGVKELRALRGAGAGNRAAVEVHQRVTLAGTRARAADKLHVAQVAPGSADGRIDQISFFFPAQRDRFMLTRVLKRAAGQGHAAAETARLALLQEVEQSICGVHCCRLCGKLLHRASPSRHPRAGWPRPGV